MTVAAALTGLGYLLGVLMLWPVAPIVTPVRGPLLILAALVPPLVLWVLVPVLVGWSVAPPVVLAATFLLLATVDLASDLGARPGARGVARWGPSVWLVVLPVVVAIVQARRGSALAIGRWWLGPCPEGGAPIVSTEPGATLALCRGGGHGLSGSSGADFSAGVLAALAAVLVGVWVARRARLSLRGRPEALGPAAERALRVAIAVVAFALLA